MSTGVHIKVAYCQILHKFRIAQRTAQRLFTRVTNHIPEGDTLMTKSSCKSVTESVAISSCDLRERAEIQTPKSVGFSQQLGLCWTFGVLVVQHFLDSWGLCVYKKFAFQLQQEQGHLCSFLLKNPYP